MIELAPVTLDLDGWMGNLRRDRTPERVFCYEHGGSGNWVTEYIPVDNYLVMLDEARRYTT